MPKTIAEQVAEGGVEALDSASLTQLEEAKEIVQRQVDALAQCKQSVERLNAGETLTARDRSILASVVGYYPDEVEARHAAEPSDYFMETFFKTPEAYFYVDGSDGSRLKVIVKAGEEIKLVPDSHADFI